MRLTNKLREQVLEDAIRDIFKAKGAGIVTRVNKLAVQVYEHQFGAEAEALQSVKVKYNWLSSCSSTAYLKNSEDRRVHLHTKETGRIYRSTCDKYTFLEDIFRLSGDCQLGKTCIFPPHNGSGVNIQKAAHVKQFEKLQAEALGLLEEERKLLAELRGFLYACSNRKELVANWPEGEKYLPTDTRPKKLPIPLVDNVRKAMGAVK